MPKGIWIKLYTMVGRLLGERQNAGPRVSIVTEGRRARRFARHHAEFAGRAFYAERRRPDLWRDETVDVADAALGTKLKVPTLDGEAKVNVPAGTQPDTVLRLEGKGLPRFKRAATTTFMSARRCACLRNSPRKSASCSSVCRSFGAKRSDGSPRAATSGHSLPIPAGPTQAGDATY